MCTLPEDAAVVASTIASPPRQTVPTSVAAAAVFQLSRRKRRREGETTTTTTTTSSNNNNNNNSTPIMLDSENSSLLASDGDSTTDNTLLRRLLVSADLASVRNHSTLIDGNVSLRRTSSMSLGSSQIRSSNLSTEHNSEDKRPRRATMFSQLTLPRRSPHTGSPDRDDNEDGELPYKRPKEGSEIVSSGGSSPPVPIKLESKSPHEGPNDEVVIASVEKNIPKFPMKPTQRWRLKSPTRQPPSHSLSPPAMPTTTHVDFNGAPAMRPRARTASELDSVVKMFTQRFATHQKRNLARLRDFGPPLGASRSLDPMSSASSSGKASKTVGTPRGDGGMEKPSDMTSPLSQLLESTPPYSSSAIHTRANTITSVFPWSSANAGPSGISRSNTNTTNSTTNAALTPARLCLPFLTGNSSLRIMSTSNPTKPPDLQVLELSKNTLPTSASTAADTMASLLAASGQFFQGIRDEQVLDFSRKEVPKPPLPLSLATDDILQWSTSAANQAAALQQLFRLPDSGTAAAASNSRPTVATDDGQTARLPVRLSSVNPLLLCRRVAEWMLVANAWTIQLCPPSVVPPNALLATAATYKFCRCSEAEVQSAPPITPTLAMPRVSPALRSVLHRIWPQLLLASMIRENFAFTVVAIQPPELNILLGRDAAVNGGAAAAGSILNSGMEVNIAKMGTANALRSLIEAGNSLLLDTQVLECVRKCIFAQREFPTLVDLTSYSVVC